jgi:hypothetical protein
MALRPGRIEKTTKLKIQTLETFSADINCLGRAHGFLRVVAVAHFLMVYPLRQPSALALSSRPKKEFRLARPGNHRA